jgi:hypothetical protein
MARARAARRRGAGVARRRGGGLLLHGWMGATATADGASAGDGAGGVTSLPPELDWNRRARLRLLCLDRDGEGTGRCARLYSPGPLVPVGNTIRD